MRSQVDIDPPPRTPDDPSDEVLEALGLPTHHVHYSSSPEKMKSKEASEHFETIANIFC